MYNAKLLNKIRFDTFIKQIGNFFIIYKNQNSTHSILIGQHFF